MDFLVRRVRCARTDRGRVLRQAVGKPGHVRYAVADSSCGQSENTDAPRAERGGFPDSDRERRSMVHGAQETGRAGGVRSLSALEPRSVADWRTVAAR